MASKILLISVNQCESPYPVFPLGLAYIDAALKQAGHQTKWIDQYIDRLDVLQALEQSQPDFVGISLRNIDDVLIKKRQTFFDDLKPLCHQVRQRSPAKVILGGSGFSIFPEQLLTLCDADFGIHGEGEASLLQLIEALEKQIDPSGIPGLVFRQGNRVVINPCRSNRKESGYLPSRPKALVDGYLQKSSMLNIQTQRGCAFHCCYCTYPLIEGRNYRRRDPELVAEEFQAIERLGARHAFIVDSVFNSSAEHVAAICEAILRRKVSVQWGCFLRPKGLTTELMRLMTRAGLSHIEFGSDSFCDSVLESYGKQFTFDDILQSSELARRQGTAYCHFLICGGPGETLRTLQIGFGNSQRLNQPVILALVGMRVYPGTPLFERVRSEGRLAAGEELLKPYYYLSPDLTADGVFEQLKGFARRSPNWIVGDPPAAYLKAVERLRAQGIVGPLWSYYPLMQRWADLLQTSTQRNR